MLFETPSSRKQMIKLYGKNFLDVSGKLKE